MKDIAISVLFLLLLSSTLKATHYFVNDADPSRSGDIYTTVVGNAGNNGLTAAAPKLSIQAIISTYALVGGDTIFIDAGTYNEDVIITSLAATSNIVFIGVSNTLTVIHGIPGGNLATVQITNSNRTHWKNLKIIGNIGETGVNVHDNSNYNEFANCDISGGEYAIDIIQVGPGSPPSYNKIHDCIIFSTYVGVRMKYGANHTDIHDNTIRVSKPAGVGTVYAAIEMQYATDNSVYRNKISSSGNSTEGTVHLGHYSTGNLFQNNYITNETGPTGGFVNSAIEIDDNHSNATFIHNSVYSIGDCFHVDPISGGTTATSTVLRNNILYSSTGVCIELPLATSKFSACDNNLYYAPTTGNVAIAGGVSMALAAWKTYDPDVAAFNEAEGLYGDPNFIGPMNVNLDLVSTSIAIDAVVNIIASVLEDIYMTGRPVGPLRDIGAFELTTPLPVKFISFSGQCINEGITLTWVTGEEVNHHHFSCEYSSDGISFHSISNEIKGSGGSHSPMTYHFWDNNSGEGYYRIKQLDNDGRVDYSTVINIQCNNIDASASVWQYDGKVIVEFYNNENNSEGLVSLYSINGQLLQSESYKNLSIGFNRLEPPITLFAQGIYIVVFRSGNVITVKKIKY